MGLGVWKIIGKAEVRMRTQGFKRIIYVDAEITKNYYIRDNVEGDVVKILKGFGGVTWR